MVSVSFSVLLGEGRKCTPKINDHHNPFCHRTDKEHLPSWPCQEEIRSKHPAQNGSPNQGIPTFHPTPCNPLQNPPEMHPHHQNTKGEAEETGETMERETPDAQGTQMQREPWSLNSEDDISLLQTREPTFCPTQQLQRALAFTMNQSRTRRKAVDTTSASRVTRSNEHFTPRSICACTTRRNEPVWGELGTDSFVARPERKMYHAGFVGQGMEMVMVIYFGSVPFSPMLHVRELPEFASLMSMDRKWPRCLLWHGWLPGLRGIGGRNPWAASFGQRACCELERRLGACLVDASSFLDSS